MRRMIRRWLCFCTALLLLCGTAGCGIQPEPAPDFSGEAQTLSVGSPVKHYYDALDNTEKHAYNAVLSEIRSFPERIAVPSLTNTQLQKMYTALLYDNPELFCLDLHSYVRQSRKAAYFYPQYLMEREDYEAMLNKCIDVASDIVTLAQTASTAFGQELIVHDRLIAMCAYSDDNAYAYRNTIYGVLCGGYAACSGYAKAAKYIFDLLQIPCYVVAGISTPPGSTSDSHLWNIIQIDGRFYHLDLTWDDPVVETGSSLIHHTYFNLTDAAISETHSAFSGTDPCTAVEDNYFIHEHLLFADYGEAEQARTIEIAVQSIESGSEGFQLRFGNEKAFALAKKVLFEDQEIYPMLREIRKQSNADFAADRASYIYGTDAYTIDVVLT